MKENKLSLIVAGLLGVALVSGITMFIAKDKLADATIKKIVSSEEAGKKVLHTAMENFIKTHPEIILNSLQEYQTKLAGDMQKEALAKLGENSSDINKGELPVLGSTNADVTILAFMDPACSYCKKSNEVLKKLASTDKNLRIVFQDLPILGDNSVYAARASLAVFQIDPNKYVDIHNAIMAEKDISQANINRLIQEQNIDMTKFNDLIKSQAITDRLQKNQELAKSLGVRGIPTYLVNDKLVSGYIEYNAFANTIAEIRKAKKNSK